MIIVEPSSARFEITESSLPTDEHLLERISAAENRIARLTERLERSVDLLLRQSQNSYFDRSLVKSLIDLLSEDGVVGRDRLEKLWNERCQKDASEQEESTYRSQLKMAILAGIQSESRENFRELIDQGFALLDQHKVDQGMAVLRRAAEPPTSNAPLDHFLGEHFFRLGETKLAREFLFKAYRADPENVHVNLLLGLICADSGDGELAKELLNQATQRGGPSFAGHCGLGWVLASEKKWSKALNEFKRALDVRPSPEAHYVLASLYYQQRRDERALRHLRQAVEMDENYHEAFYLMASIHERGGKVDLAKATLEKATAALNRKSTDVQQKAKVGKLFSSKGRSHKLMSGADKRLAAALRNDALRVFGRSTS